MKKYFFVVFPLLFLISGCYSQQAWEKINSTSAAQHNKMTANNIRQYPADNGLDMYNEGIVQIDRRFAASGILTISKLAAKEAIVLGRPIAYQRRTVSGWQKVEAYPVNHRGQECAVIKIYENGELQTKKIDCE